MIILLWKFNWPHYDTRGGIKKDAVRLALTKELKKNFFLHAFPQCFEV